MFRKPLKYRSHWEQTESQNRGPERNRCNGKRKQERGRLGKRCSASNTLYLRTFRFCTLGLDMVRFIARLSWQSSVERAEKSADAKSARWRLNSVRSLLLVTLLTHRIVRWLPDFWEIRGSMEIHIRFWSENLRRRKYLGSLSTEILIILKIISKKRMRGCRWNRTHRDVVEWRTLADMAMNVQAP
jgi:hypothetical protein